MNWPSEVEIVQEWLNRKTNGKSHTWVDALEWVQGRVRGKSTWSEFMLKLNNTNCVYGRIEHENGETQQLELIQKIYVDLELVKQYLEGVK